MNRVGRGKDDVAHAFQRCGVGRLAADVPGFAFGIGADDQEVRAGGDAAVAGAGRQDQHIAGADGYGPAALAPEDQVAFAAGEAENFVGGRMEVVEVVDSVALLRGPAVVLKGSFHG